MKGATVLIVDDSRVYRAAVEAALSEQDGIAVIGSVFSGEKAIDFMQRRFPDVVTLDVEMPGMNGLETLEAIERLNRERAPGTEAGVIMVSAYTKRGADVTMLALQAGAIDFVTKPTGESAEENLKRLRQELVPRIRLFIARRNRTSAVVSPSPPSATGLAARPMPATATPKRTLQVILVGASTGGPKALAALLPDLVAKVDAPIMIVQHMPPHFTRSLAEHLARHTRCSVVEAEDGQLLLPRSAYIAPGGRHLTVRRNGAGRLVAGLNDDPPESGCRPSANVLFRSAAAIVGRETVAILLTGMGNDGTDGLAPLRRAGAYVVVQDEESSVVWGMPGSALAAGLVDSVCPLTRIAATIETVVEMRKAP